MTKDLKQLTKQLVESAKKLQQEHREVVTAVAFDYEEQELIFRVFSSTMSQMKSKKDKNVAKDILKKTKWTEGKD